MKRLPSLLSWTAAIVAAVLAGLFAVSTPAQADALLVQRFYADSGDQCPYGITQGTLEWVRIPFNENAVNVRGELIDRPTPNDPNVRCGDDRRYSVATFTAYSGRTVVDSEARRADNGHVTFSFQLNSRAFALIDLVVVQVCRPAVTPSPPVYCGPREEYRSTSV
jgi:hypothetical protein